MKSRDKKLLLNIFRKRNKPKVFMYLTFSALLAILFSKTKIKVGKIIIDSEYSGHEDTIKAWIIDFSLWLKLKRLPNFEFGFIGKSSNAHKIALKVRKKGLKADHIVKLKDLVDLIF